MEHFYNSDVFGEAWFDYENLYTQMVNEFPTGSVFVEVGSWKGRSAAYMCVEIANSGKSIEFYCVDHWLYPDYPHIRLYNEFLSNLQPVGEYFHALKLESIQAARLFEDNSIDFVFIDADHDYNAVKADILAWYPKVKKGGIIAGHDYVPDSLQLEVYKVVNELFPNDLELVRSTNPDRTNAYCFLKRKL
jgi:predicted O-methyltransferase YrrM